jgi:hypothetical protein
MLPAAPALPEPISLDVPAMKVVVMQVVNFELINNARGRRMKSLRGLTEVRGESYPRLELAPSFRCQIDGDFLTSIC